MSLLLMLSLLQASAVCVTGLIAIDTANILLCLDEQLLRCLLFKLVV